MGGRCEYYIILGFGLLVAWGPDLADIVVDPAESALDLGADVAGRSSQSHPSPAVYLTMAII